MPNSDLLNTLILTVLLLGVAGLGAWITQKKQPAQLERLEQEETALQLREAEITELLAAQSSSEELAEQAVRRWNARYKVLPTRLTSPAVVEYLNELSAVGFQRFNVSLGGVARRSGFSTLSYDIEGAAFYEALYRFVWEVENGRGLYRVRDLTVSETEQDLPNEETGVPRRLQLVQFSMTLEAYFGGAEGMSAPDSMVSVPDHVLPPRTPVANPFFPLVMEELPPNTDDLVEVESDELISVIGDVAVFRGSLGPRPVREGDAVWLGRIVEVDPAEAKVVADLSKGGIRERVEVHLATGERYRQALGRVRLTPAGAVSAAPGPPQPGTPEYRRARRAAAGPGSDAPATSPVEVAPPAAEAPTPPQKDAEPQFQPPPRGVGVRSPFARPPADDS